MATTTVKTIIANPAKGSRKGTPMKRLSAKQIKAGFGGKRRQAAMKRRKPRAAPKKRHRPAAQKSKPNPSTKKRVRATATRPKKRSRKNSHHRMKTRKNSPELLMLTAGNPAQRRSTNMAKKRKKKARATASRPNAGRRRAHAPKKHHSRRYRSNPGSFLGRPMDWVIGGAGVLAGGTLSTIIPQAVLGDSNTGAMGYVATGITAIALGWGAHMVFGRTPVLAGAVVAGGFGALLRRVITDKTPYGSALASSGVGDYIAWNYVTPQRAVGMNAGTIDTSWMTGGGVTAGGVPDWSGTDLGRRGSVC
jgi:hypothetical protein